MENSKQPIYPIINSHGFPSHAGAVLAEDGKSLIGLTKREYASIEAMKGIISGRELQLSKEEADMVASQAIQFADSILEKLETK